MTAPATLTPAQQTIITKLNDLEAALNGDLVERHTEIKTAMVALISRRHHFQVGPPGVAKSLLVRRLFAYLGGMEKEHLFQLLLTKYTTPDEVFGPPSLKSLENDEFRRNLKNMLPRARIAFLDEIFKANSSILNAFLTIMNERLFFNGTDGPIRVPLETIFAASNELPMGDELNAMWDRLHFRHELRPVQDGGNFVKMLKHKASIEPEPLITWAEIIEAQAFVNQVALPGDIYDTLKTLRDNLRKNCGIEVTDRRFVESLPIIQATAFINGRMTADIDDMRLLRHVFWTRIEDIKPVSQAVLELSNPIDKEATDLLEQVEILSQMLDDAVSQHDTPKVLAKTAVEIHGKLKKAKKEMETLKTAAEASGRPSEVLDALSDRFKTIGTRLMSVFAISDKELG